MDHITLFDTIHVFYCTISANFYFYLQYFQQKVLNFSKMSGSQTDLAYVWIALKLFQCLCLTFLCGSRVLFMRFASTAFSKFNFKTRFHGTIHIFKNYFATMFTVFSNKQYPKRLLMSLFILFYLWMYYLLIYLPCTICITVLYYYILELILLEQGWPVSLCI